MTTPYDCVVLGAGPAGTTTAALVAQAGFRTLVVERDRFPRFHVGESLMPETYWVFQRLGVLDRLKRSSFPKKYSVQFVNHAGKESAPFYFFEADPRECSVTWQVLRSDFDQLMLENALDKGAECWQETRALDVLTEGERVVGVRVQRRGQPPQEVPARVVVDATGQQSFLAHRFGLREELPGLRKASVWTYFRGAYRDPGIDQGATVILHTQDRQAWFWYIPLPDDITSVGVVGDTDYLLSGGKSPQQVFAEQVSRCPAVARRIEGAEQVEPGPGEPRYRVIRDFSYLTRRPAGPGWVLVGDAFGFLDPIYSSGVFLALVSGQWAAEAIIHGLESGNLSAEQLGRWAEPLRRGMKWIHKLIRAFYTPGFSFGRFIRAYPQHRNNLTDLLVGKVFHQEAGRIFDDLDPWLERLTATGSAN